MGIRQIVIAIGFAVVLPGAAGAWPDTAGPESRRMSRAKDFIADEQWGRAVEELRAAIADSKENNKDEALFWLAHSFNQENDFAASVEAIRRLERDFASSRWVKPARSLLIELAQKLERNDVLWWTATPRPPKPAMLPAPPLRSTPKARAPMAKPAEMPLPPGPAAATVPPAPAPAPPAVPSTPPVFWVAETWSPDSDQRILALGSLIHTDGHKVIPWLREIALEGKNPGAARSAVFVLAHSGKPEAHSVLVEVAKRGPELVKVAAVRELGRFGGPDVSNALLQVYSTAKPLVKRQVVNSLGERKEAAALLRIAQSEDDRHLRDTAIVTLGRAGGRDQLRVLYTKSDHEGRRAIIIGLFTVRGEAELIWIADQEKDRRLRDEVLQRLRLLGTPKARAYLARLHP